VDNPHLTSNIFSRYAPANPSPAHGRQVSCQGFSGKRSWLFQNNAFLQLFSAILSNNGEKRFTSAIAFYINA